MLASVLLPIPFCRRAGALTYEVPPDTLRGQIVLAPFGKQVHRGVVIALLDHVPADVDAAKVRSILGRDPSLDFTPERLDWAKWVARYYASPLLDVLRLFLPGEVWTNGLPPLAEEVVLIEPAPPSGAIEGLRRARVQRAAYEQLAGAERLPISAVTGTMGITRETLRALAARGLLRIVEEELPTPDLTSLPSALDLTSEQASALAAVLDPSGSNVSLLFGVTGSGKTEVYLAAMEHVLREGRSALLLVPEIALTPQTISRVEQRFPGAVAVVHSGLTDHQRALAWSRAARGHARVVVGPRSALFAPLRDLGLIVIDEEHESTYKQDTAPRYHARTAAFDIAQRLHIPLLLGSATPAAETYHAAMTKKIRLLELRARVAGGVHPPIEVVDLRPERAAGIHNVLSTVLMDAIETTWKAGRQTILFLNRRGFAPVLQCRSCGEIVRCPNCSIPHTVHRIRLPDAQGRTELRASLLCHICAATAPIPDACPSCGAWELSHLGTGTQRLEEELIARFPGIRVLRADRDTTRGVDAHGRIYEAVLNGEADVLVGTQMIAKGLDLPAVDLVGVVLADQGLARPDFPATEHAVALLTQVAGRAGRRGGGGRVILQTLSPESAAIQAVVSQDLGAFLSSELLLRQTFNFPPFSRLARLSLSAPTEEAAAEGLRALAHRLEPIAALRRVEVRGPVPGLVAKRRGLYTEHLLLRAKDRSSFDSLLEHLPAGVQVDIDPVDLD